MITFKIPSWKEPKTNRKFNFECRNVLPLKDNSFGLDGGLEHKSKTGNGTTIYSGKIVQLSIDGIKTYFSDEDRSSGITAEGEIKKFDENKRFYPSDRGRTCGCFLAMPVANNIMWVESYLECRTKKIPSHNHNYSFGNFAQTKLLENIINNVPKDAVKSFMLMNVDTCEVVCFEPDWKITKKSYYHDFSSSFSWDGTLCCMAYRNQAVIIDNPLM